MGTLDNLNLNHSGNLNLVNVRNMLKEAIKYTQCRWRRGVSMWRAEPGMWSLRASSCCLVYTLRLWWRVVGKAHPASSLFYVPHIAGPIPSPDHVASMGIWGSDPILPKGKHKSQPRNLNCEWNDRLEMARFNFFVCVLWRTVHYFPALPWFPSYLIPGCSSCSIWPKFPRTNFYCI